jgi:hypothetical protein
MLLAMCACVNCYFLRWDSYGNVSNSLLTLLTMAVLVGFPITVGVLYSRPHIFARIYQREEQFMSKFGSLI